MWGVEDQRSSTASPTIHGVVLGCRPGDASDGCFVELWDYIEHAPRFLAEVRVDEDGRFSFASDGILDDSSVHGYELRCVASNGAILHSEHRFLADDPWIELRVPELMSGARSSKRGQDPPAGAVAPERASGWHSASPSGRVSVALSPNREDNDVGELDTEELVELARELARRTNVPETVYGALARLGLPLAPETWIDLSAGDFRQLFDQAIDQGFLDAVQASALDDLVERVCAVVAESAIAVRGRDLGSTLGAVIANLDLPPEQVRELIAAYQLRSPDAGTQDITEAASTSGLADDLDLGWIIALADAVGSDPLLIRKLHQGRRAGEWSELEDLADLDFDAWADLVEQSHREAFESAAEDELSEEDFEAYVADRANAVLDQFEATYPSAFIRREMLAAGNLGEATRVLLTNAKQHDLLGSSLRSLAHEQPQLLKGIASEQIEDALSEAEAIQRLSQVTQRASEVRILHNSQLNAAQDFGCVSRRAFAEAFEDALGDRAQAARIHAQAQHIAAVTQINTVGMLQEQHPVPFVLRPAADELRKVPNLGELFGKAAGCDCPHCGSVYSPAAYLVDLMRYLDAAHQLSDASANANATKSAKTQSHLRYNPLDLLLARRPDLAEIPLTCENTLTPLPYIDLVNEILEARVARASWLPDTGKVPADILAAIPQSVNTNAYAVLRNAIYPIGLPFHEPLAVFRRYLGHFGVSRLALLRTFSNTSQLTEDLVSESLGMSREELALVTSPIGDLWRHLGLPTELPSQELVARVCRAPALMHVLGLTFAELVDVVSLRFVTQVGRLALESPGVDCEPEKIVVAGLESRILERIVRVVRLQRRLGWKFTELDRVLRVLAASELDIPTLHKVVAIRDLAQKLDLSPTELVVLWGPLDSSGTPNPFAALFHTRVVSWHVGQEHFRLRTDGLELAAPRPDLTPFVPALLAAFRVTHDDLLIAKHALAGVGVAPQFDLKGLSALYRFVLLARALRLKARQLAILLRLAPEDANPFAPADPTCTVRFVDLVTEVRESPFSPEQIGYLFLNEIEPRQDPTPKPAQVRSTVANVRRSIVDAYQQTAQPTEVSIQVLREKLALLLDGPLLDTAVEVVNPKSRLDLARRREFFARHLAGIFPDPNAAAQRLFGTTGERPLAASAVELDDTHGEQAELEAATLPPLGGAAPPVTSSPVASAALGQDEQLRSNIAFVLEYLLPSLRGKQIRGAIVQVLGDSIGLSSASTDRLLERALRSRRLPSAPILADFTALLGSGLTAAYHGNGALQGTPTFTRVESEIAFPWAGSEPAPGVPAVNFSLRLSGRYCARASAEHVFYVTTDGSVRLTIVVDGAEQELLRQPAARGGSAEHAATAIRLSAGMLYEIRLEYRNHGASAHLSLAVGSGPTSKSSIPSTELFPLDGLTSLEQVEDSYRRLQKTAFLLSGLGATDTHVRWFTSEPVPLDLDAISGAPASDGAKHHFARFRQLWALYALRKKLAPTATDLFEVFGAPSPTETVTRLLQATGWDAHVVGELLGLHNTPRVNASDGALPEPLLIRLSRAIEIQSRVGVSVATLVSWASRQPDDEMATHVVQAVKARYDEKRWLDVAKGLNDALRIERRDALVKYLLPRLAEKGVHNRNQLFEYFLIDVDMSPCMLTSRIRQAIGSLQTFYQRCLMNLELVHPRLIDAADWKWMKNYRVWEANRKVFLYPENWIEPELRDDKSPLFAEFERAILQDEIKDQNVESAFVDFLQGLDEISRLDVRATYFEPGTARSSRGSAPGFTPPRWDTGVYHVFARTFSPPHVWFHRRLATGLWSAWEKIEADIEGDHLVPVVFNGRMHLFWAMFREVSKQPPQGSRRPKDDDPIVELGKDWEIQLAYAVYDRGRWSRKRVSDRGIRDVVSLRTYSHEASWDQFKLVRDLGSTSWSASSYRFEVAIVDDGARLRMDVGRRRIVNSSGSVLDARATESIGQFVLEGCNGQLRGIEASNSGGVYVTGPAAKVIGDIFSRRRINLPPATNTRRPFRTLTAPVGFQLDGQGFATQLGARELAFKTPEGLTAAAVLSQVPADGTRLLFTHQVNSHLAPYFMQTLRHSFFVQPAGEAWVRSVPLPAPGGLLRFGGARKRPRAAARKGKPTRGSRESAEPEDFVAGAEGEEQRLITGSGDLYFDSELTTGAALDEPVTQDQLDDEAEDAWHPDDAAERVKRRSRSARPKPKQGGAASARRAAQRRVAPPTPSARIERIVNQRVRFVNFQHPRSGDLLLALRRGGIDALFEAACSKMPTPFARFQQYRPTALVDKPEPRFDIDFDLRSPYGAYNWELLFHAPLLVANRLAKEGRHDEAQRWFHFIFDPTSDDSDPSIRRFWRFLPFKDMRQIRGIGADLTDAAIAEWMQKPFNPHAVARLRRTAYQKTVVMKYIDNLVEWGDRLFRKDTMESIQEATQLYVLAGNILGPRPERIPRAIEPAPATFRQIRNRADRFGNWKVRIETSQIRRPFQIAARPDHRGVAQALNLDLDYFCFPHNPQLDKYWDTVQDRLFKIRNCMNIQGVVRQLPLFEPPIDPAMLVRAFAAGVDLSSVLSNLNAPRPHHRFAFLMNRALRLAEELRSFGLMTQRALERRDAEGIAAIRANNELGLSRAIREVRKVAVRQVEEELEEANLRREELDLRIQYLTTQVQQLMNPQETASQAALIAAKAYTVITEGIELASKIAYAIPEIQSGGAGMSSPFVTLQLGGQMFGSITSAVASSIQKITERSEVEAQMAETQAEFQRRRAQWQQEIDVLNKERSQLDKEIASINMRLDGANKELRRYELEVENAGRVQEYLRTKFTNEQLYAWMLGQLASVHFQAYKFAFDAAQQAQAAYQFEQTETKNTFIEFSYWDSLRKGLFAGERLLLDLRRLESAYLEGRQRALEVTRHLSLLHDFPLAFDELLATGRCEFTVSEALLDGDFPGHYFRRIKTISLSIPGIQQSLANVNCTLTLLSNRVRIDASASGNYAAAEDGEDARFLANLVPIQAIATSQLVQDSGMFQLKLDDERFLPFEGAGAISRWRLTLNQSDNALSTSVLRDVVVSLSYTARQGGAALEQVARAQRERAMAQGVLPIHHRLSLREHSPNLFVQLKTAQPGADVEMKLLLRPESLPGRLRAFENRVERVVAVIHLEPRSTMRPDGVQMHVTAPKGSAAALGPFILAWANAKALRGTAETSGPLGEWILKLGTANQGLASDIADISLCFELRPRRS